MQTVYAHIAITVVEKKIGADKATLYTVKLQSREAVWYVDKKYADIALLHSSLAVHHAAMPELPAKSLFSFFASDEEDEASTLQQYLRQLTIRPDILNSEQFKAFFSLDTHSPKILCNTPRLLGEFNIITKKSMITTATRGVQDFYFDSQLETIIIITADMNAVSRVNSYITNTKMPWEAEEEAKTLLAVGTVECWVKLKNDYGYQKIWIKIYPSQAVSMYYCKTRETLLVGLEDGTTDELKVSSRIRYTKYEQCATMKLHNDYVSGMYLDPVSSTMYSISHDSTLVTFDMVNYLRMHVGAHMQQLETLLPDPANKRLFIGAEEGHIYMYDTSKRIPALLFSIATPQNGPITALQVDLVKNYLFAVGESDGMIMAFELGKPGREKFTKQIAVLEGKQGASALGWAPSNMQILVGNKSGAITFWNSQVGETIYVLKVGSDQISKIWIDDSKRLILTATKGNMIRFWELPKFWRDPKVVHREQEEEQQRRKVDNALKIKAQAKKAALNSDEDDLAYWHMETSSDQQSDTGIIPL